MNAERRYDLDWLRVIAFGLLMLFHTGMMFSTWDWHVKNFQTSDYFDHVMRWLHAWRMPLLFFISGSAVWFAMDRLSHWRFFVERQKRLLLPLIFGMLVVIPPQVYFERLYHQQQYDSFLDFYQTLFTLGSYPEGNLSWHHLWYVPYIWAFSMLMLPFFIAAKTECGRRIMGRALQLFSRPWLLFLIFIPSAVAEMILRPHWPGDADNLLADWGNFTHKLTFFVAGFCLASAPAIYDALAKHWRKFLSAAIGAYIVLFLVWAGRFHCPSRVYWFLSNFNVWMWLLAVLGLGRRYLCFNHPLLRAANEAVYPFYILHQTVIIAFAYQLCYVNWSIGTKFLFVVGGTFLTCWGLYTFAVKPWNIMRVCFGMKWRASYPTNRPSLQAVTQISGSTAQMPRAVLLIALGSLLVLGLAACGRSKARLVCHEILASSLSSNTMGINSRQRLIIYLPPSYAVADRRFPVLYWLPNFKTDLWRYTGGTFQKFRFEEAMARQLRTGAAKEMIIVVPNATHILGSSWYRNSPLTGNWEDFISRDVVQFVDQHYRTIPSADGRALAGHGVGGLGAIELALKHPDVFCALYAMSAAVLDQRGITNLGPAVAKAANAFNAHVEGWKNMPEPLAQKSFRNFIQTSLNSPRREREFSGLLTSYAAAMSPDLSQPYPHFNFSPQRLDEGMGMWREKLERYLKQPLRLKAITLEYARDDDYEWLRRGSDALSQQMNTLGISQTIAVHRGSHESALGERMETGMLPAISRVFSSL